MADHQSPESDSMENQPEQVWEELGDEAQIFSRCRALGHISSYGAGVLSVGLSEAKLPMPTSEPNLHLAS